MTPQQPEFDNIPLAVLIDQHIPYRSISVVMRLNSVSVQSQLFPSAVNNTGQEVRGHLRFPVRRPLDQIMRRCQSAFYLDTGNLTSCAYG